MTKRLTMTVGTARRAVRNLALLAAVAVAIGARAETETVGGYTWTYWINGDTAAIHNYGNYGSVAGSVAISPSPTGAVTIPSTLGGKPVTSIGYLAFYGCSGLTSVTIPDSVTSIDGRAFSGCSGLTKIEVGAENPAYKSVSGLLLSKDGTTLIRGVNGDVTIPDSVTSIGNLAFYGCSGLTSVTIPDSVTSIGDYAFYYCSGLTSVTIPDSVTSIGDYAFYYCSGLTSVTIGNGAIGIGRWTFSGCRKLLSAWDRTLANASAAEGMGGVSPSVVTTVVQQVVTTVVQQVAAPYALTDHAADRAIASVTVNGDCAIDSFVLKDGEVYDCALRIVNTADHDVKVSMPSGYEYETFEGVDPLTIPANSRNLLTITRVADKTFLVSREKLTTVR